MMPLIKPLSLYIHNDSYMRQPQARLCRGMVHCLMDFQKIYGKILIHIHSGLDFSTPLSWNFTWYYLHPLPTTPNPNATPPQNFVKIPSYVLFNVANRH